MANEEQKNGTGWEESLQAIPDGDLVTHMEEKISSVHYIKTMAL